jgi:hypothetical protein
MDDALLVRLSATQLLCPFAVQGRIFAGEVGGDHLLIALNREGALVGLEDPTSKTTIAYTGLIDRAGQKDQVIYWGLWRQGQLLEADGRKRVIDDSNAIPFIVGVGAHTLAISDRWHCDITPASPPVCSSKARFLSELPSDGIANYALVGEAGVVSSRDFTGAIVPTGTVRKAQASVDFKNHSVQLQMAIEVRGTTAVFAMPLLPRDKMFGLISGAEGYTPCTGAPEEWCPTASAQFYGRDGEFMGVTFLYVHNALLPESAWVSAHLANVNAVGAVVLQKIHP